jgi:hypothetical protein
MPLVLFDLLVVVQEDTVVDVVIIKVVSWFFL